MPLLEDSKLQAYKPGQVAPTSGIYTVIHQEHRPPHEVLAIRGEEFPSCRGCKDQVRFEVASPIPHMMHDFDLTGPRLQVVRRRTKAARRGAS
jgi:hypothetical protein